MKKRVPIAKLNKEAKFTNGSTIGDDLTTLTLDDLAQRYVSIEQQSQLYKGLILLEARERFESDKEFGEWVVTHGLSVGTNQQNRTLFMNLARFFKNRDMTGISLTAAYEISRPQNANVAEDIYSYSLLKNLSVFEVKAKIQELKNQTGLPATVERQKKEFVLNKNLSRYKNLIVNGGKELPIDDVIRVLKLCLNEYQEKKKNSNFDKTPQAS